MSSRPDLSAFHAQAIARLQAGAILYGDASYQRPVRELLNEICEELVDVEAWGTIALNALERDPDLSAAERATVRAAIVDAGQDAEVSYRRILDASRSLTPPRARDDLTERSDGR
jgi:superfamily I DNA/RNA helicase